MDADLDALELAQPKAARLGVDSFEPFLKTHDQSLSADRFIVETGGWSIQEFFSPCPTSVGFGQAVLRGSLVAELVRNGGQALLHSGLMAEMSTLHEPISLGSKIRIWPPVVLAPMAGVTNYPYRKICHDQGAGLCVSEMVSSRGILEGGRKTWKLAWFGPQERPRSIQIFGCDPGDMAEAAR